MRVIKNRTSTATRGRTHTLVAVEAVGTVAARAVGRHGGVAHPVLVVVAGARGQRAAGHDLAALCRDSRRLRRRLEAGQPLARVGQGVAAFQQRIWRTLRLGQRGHHAQQHGNSGRF